MNIFINFYILSFLIGLNSSMYINIIIDKKGLKSEPKIFEGENGQFGEFVVKMAKQLKNGEWEYASGDKSITVMADCETRLDAPREWVKLYREEVQEFELLEPEYKANKPFLLFMKVEMADDNKSIEPIPFILGTCGEKLTIHLNEEENGKIVGICSGRGQSEGRINLAKKWRTIYEKMKMEKEKEQISKSLQQMAPISEVKNANYSNDQENIQKISKEEWEKARKKRKRTKISGDKPLPAETHLQSVGPKLMQSSIKSAHSGKKEQQNILKHGREKDNEIGHDERNENHPKQQQKLMPDSLIYSHFREQQQNKNLWPGENLATATAAGHIVNEGIIGYTDEYGGKQNEFTQINPTGFIHQHQQQGNIPQIDETEAEDPMQFWHKILHDLPPKPTESMGGTQHEFTQINPNRFTHQGQGNLTPTKNAAKSFGKWGKHFHENLPIQPINIVESMGHENLQIQKTKISSAFNANGPLLHYGKTTKNMIDAPTAVKHFTAIGHNEEESDLPSIFFHDQNPSIEQILSESSNSHSGKFD